MNKIIIIFVFLYTCTFASKGEVIYASSGCDWFIVQTDQGMVLLEWYGGNSPDIGDEIVGEFRGFGMRSLYNLTVEREVRVWQENYMMSKENALKQLYEKCN